MKTIYIPDTNVYCNIRYSYTLKRDIWFFFLFTVSEKITYIIILCIIPTYMAIFKLVGDSRVRSDMTLF